MSHYTIDYSGLDAATAQTQAIADIIDYVGQEQFDRSTLALRDAIACGCTLDECIIPMSLFLGVSGLPARAWFVYCGGVL
jgi:hypothetical protein